MKSLMKNSVFNTLYTILNLAFPLIISTYVARVLLPDGVGKVAYAQTIVAYFVMLAMLGIPNYGLREISKVRDDFERKSKLFSELVAMNAVSTIIALILFIIMIVNVESFYSQYLLFGACGSLIFFNLFNIDWLYQGEEEYEYIVFRSICVKIITLILIFFLVNDTGDIVIYAMLLTFATAGNYFFNLYHAKKYVKLRFNNIRFKQHFKPVIIMAIGVLLSSIYGKIDITMHKSMASDTNIGYYSYANKIIEICITICTSITAVFMPRLSYYYKYDKEKFYVLLKTGTDILSLVTFPMCIGVYILAPELIYILFGQDFVHAALTVRVLSILVLIKSYGNLLCFQLVMCTGNEKERIPATAIGSTANIVFNWWLIPIWLELGAAVATVISELVVNGYQFVQMKKKLNFKISLLPITQSCISAIFMGGACMLLKGFNCSVYIYTLLAFLVGGGVYIMCNILLGNKLLIEMFNKVFKHH